MNNETSSLNTIITADVAALPHGVAGMTDGSASGANRKPSHGCKNRIQRSWAATERFLVAAGDWLNPILVKETRQAIKSFQFALTFLLVLIGCWLATIAGIVLSGPWIYYAAEGGSLLIWYYIILAFALIVIVPYAAYRSLAAEREDNTFDLLSITTLKPRQIISGKLGSAVVQMGVYFSAITPCLAFTYLLRGVDLPAVAMLVGELFFLSLGLSMFGLLLATLTKRRFTHVFASVALVGMLLLLFWHVVKSSVFLVTSSSSYLASGDFWIGLLLTATFYVTTFALAYFAAAGMISFTSENRSTPLRICMLVQTAAIIGWMTFIWFDEKYDSAIVLTMAGVGLTYWYVMGAMLTTERPGMSQRVRRRLPQSFLSRVLFSWFNPGPATGYMFAVANAIALALMCFIGAMASASTGGTGRWSGFPALMYALPIGWSYLVAYLGLGLLIITALRRIAVVTMLASVLIHFLLLLAGFGIPYAIKSMTVAIRDLDYSFLQITDPIFSLKHVVFDNVPAVGAKLLLIVPSFAICVLLGTMPLVIRELRVVHEAAPKRVLEDEAELHPVQLAPANPWDEPAVTD